MTMTHQADGQQQGELDIDHRIADRLRAVGHQVDMDRLRHRGEARPAAIIALMLSTTSTVLAPGWRKISSSLAALAVEPRRPVRGDLVASTTVADVPCILIGRAVSYRRR